ncbi:MAG: hypothetical protein JXQ69_03390 [Paludibacteraceae bacterium]|nr:hypothetical protein [Paludibacteraceae bacterium]MBN2787348.1 hypothetical protein [Paludibacteraceae bacterium]
MQLITKEQFFELTATFEWLPYTQTYGWFAFCNCDNSGNYLCLVDSFEKPQIACFCHVKKALGLKMLLLEGECLKSKNYKSSLIKSFYEGVCTLGYDMVEVVSNSVYNSEFEIGIRRAGFLRPVGAFSMPLSNWIDLRTAIKYNSNWTRNIKKSMDFQLQFQLHDSPDDELIQTIVSFYNQFTKEKGFLHQLNLEATTKLLRSSNFSLGVVTSPDNTILSCIIYHSTSSHAGLLYAAKSEEAKENGATFFMYSHLFEALRNKGVESFDMEKLVPSTHTTDGVFLFKDGVKGERVLYNGEWSWYKRRIYRPLMYFVKKCLFKKREI